MLGYGGGELCCVWWGFVEVFFWLRFLDLEFVGGPMIVVVVCGDGSWFLVGGDC